MPQEPSSSQPPSPRSLRLLAGQNRQRRPLPPALHEEGEVVEAARKKSAEQVDAENVAQSSDMDQNVPSSSTAFYHLTDPLNPSDDEPEGVHATLFSEEVMMMMTQSLQDNAGNAEVAALDPEAAVADIAYFMLTQSAADAGGELTHDMSRPAVFDAPVFPSQQHVCTAEGCSLPKAGGGCGRCSKSYCRDHMVEGSHMCQTCYSEHLSLQNRAPARPISRFEGLLDTPPHEGVLATPLALPPSLPIQRPRTVSGGEQGEEGQRTPRTPAVSSDPSPPSSPEGQAPASQAASDAAKQQRLQQRQARLREGRVDERDYKRKHARGAPRDPDKPKSD